MASILFGDIRQPNLTQAGEIAYASFKMLDRAQHLLIVEKFAKPYVLPANETDQITLRKFESLSNLPSERFMTEGVTPNPQTITPVDYTAKLKQYGGRIQVSDRMIDFHQNNIISESLELLGEQAVEVLERTRIETLLTNPQVSFSGTATAKNQVIDVFDLNMHRKVMRWMRSSLAQPLTSVVSSSPKFNTETIDASYVCLVHSHMEADLRNVSAFVPVTKYISGKAWANELGSIENTRFVYSTLLDAEAGAGAAVTTEPVMATTGNADVFPMIYLAKDAFGTVVFKGKNAVTPYIVRPTPSDSDPMALRGHIAWKTYAATIITNPDWIRVCYVAASAL